MGQRSNYAAKNVVARRLQRRGSLSSCWKKEEGSRRSLMGRSTERYALLMGAQIKLKMEECASDMGQRSNYAARKDVQIMLGMGQKISNYAAVKATYSKYAQNEGVCRRHGEKVNI